MTGLILPDGVKSTLPHPEDVAFRAKTLELVYDDFEINAPDEKIKYRHAYTHRVVDNWAVTAKEEWCPRCNGLMAARDQARALEEQLETVRKLVENDPENPARPLWEEFFKQNGKRYQDGKLVDLDPLDMEIGEPVTGKQT